jgi:hydrogenase/urease accessory protein HupE
MREATFAASTLVLALLATATPLHAHGMRTAYLELREGADGIVLGTWKVTVPAPGVAPRLGDDCTSADDASRDVAGEAHTFTMRCGGGLGGRRVAVDGLGPVLTEAVVRVLRLDGTVLSHVVTPDAPAWVVPAAQSWTGVGWDYVRLGLQHIVTGADHLLFLLALVLYVRRPRDVFVTETAFTISHSASYSATALGWVHVYAPAAEACIALSLVLVALDIGDPDAERRAAWQGPLIALVFGLVHGLGFAGALSEVGLPDHAVASALVGFGIGVEIGQVAFLVAVMLGVFALSRLAPQKTLAVAGSYLVGITGTYWLLQRLWVCFA